MITNVAFNDAKKGRIASYATYCITPSKAHVAQTSDKERLVAFECNGDRLVGTLDAGEASTGLLIISGGTEIRSGAYAGQAAMCAVFTACW